MFPSVHTLAYVHACMHATNLAICIAKVTPGAGCATLYPSEGAGTIFSLNLL